jgi:hypothetical protein
MNFTEPTIESADPVVFTLPGHQAALFRLGASVSIAVVVVMLVVLYAWKANQDLRKVKPLTTKPEYDFLNRAGIFDKEKGRQVSQSSPTRQVVSYWEALRPQPSVVRNSLGKRAEDLIDSLLGDLRPTGWFVPLSPSPSVVVRPATRLLPPKSADNFNPNFLAPRPYTPSSSRGRYPTSNGDKAPSKQIVEVSKKLPQSVVIDIEHIAYGVAISTPAEVENGDGGHEGTKRGTPQPSANSLSYDQSNDQVDVVIDIDKLIISWSTWSPTQS